MPGGDIAVMRSNFTGPVNIGSDEMITIDRLVDIVAGIASKSVHKRYIDGPTGVRGRKSDNHLIRQKLGWAPSTALVNGLRPTYEWVCMQVMRDARGSKHAVQGLSDLENAVDTFRVA
jgi:GDP-D-mannose 3', 5'-epimerase